jgi:hypothetical protein
MSALAQLERRHRIAAIMVDAFDRWQVAYSPCPPLAPSQRKELAKVIEDALAVFESTEVYRDYGNGGQNIPTHSATN